MKRILILIFAFTSLFAFFAQNPEFKISEIKGSVDISINNTKWMTSNVDETLSGNIEIVTGFHSHLTLKINEDSFITINQLTHLKIENNSITEKGTEINIYLLNGYTSVFSAKNKNRAPVKIQVNMEKGTVLFEKSSGEVFFNSEKGAVIKSLSGVVKIGAKMVKTYYITKNEICSILPGGKLVESDYYLRRQINGKPSELIESNDIESYYEQFFQNYTSKRRSNDYGNSKRP